MSFEPPSPRTGTEVPASTGKALRACVIAIPNECSRELQAREAGFPLEAPVSTGVEKKGAITRRMMRFQPAREATTNPMIGLRPRGPDRALGALTDDRLSTGGRSDPAHSPS